MFHICHAISYICNHLLYPVVENSLYTKQCVDHTDNTTKVPGYGSHVHTVFDTVPTLPLYIEVCPVLILSAYCVGVTHPILVFSLTILKLRGPGWHSD
jgi:hypothetical protein